MSLRGTKQPHAIQSEYKGVELALAVMHGVRLPRCARNDKIA
ncbi:MAG: hypothetical protein JWR09_2535 [Mucilaginibacter sp.]|nr:hypothetical protein [Mucilaginibacter sp.]